MLIYKGAVVTLKNDKGQSVLWSENYDIPKKLDLIEYLISAGADVNAKDDDSDTPLDWINVDDVDFEETADLLRKHGGKTGEELTAEGKWKIYNIYLIT